MKRTLIIVALLISLVSVANGNSIGITNTYTDNVCINGNAFDSNGIVFTNNIIASGDVTTPDDPIGLLKSKWWALAIQRSMRMAGLSTNESELKVMESLPGKDGRKMSRAAFDARVDALRDEGHIVLELDHKLLVIEVALSKLAPKKENHG